MRWFKHFTDANTNEKLSEFIDEMGLKGYGFWWLLLEIVAGKMSPSKPGNCEVTYSMTQWKRLLYSHHHYVSYCLSNLESKSLITVEKTGSKITVKIPKLLKYRDEYSKKSGHCPDKYPERLRSKSTDTDKDINIQGTNIVQGTYSEKSINIPDGTDIAQSVHSEKSINTQEGTQIEGTFPESIHDKILLMRQQGKTAREIFMEMRKTDPSFRDVRLEYDMVMARFQELFMKMYQDKYLLETWDRKNMERAIEDNGAFEVIEAIDEYFKNDRISFHSIAELTQNLNTIRSGTYIPKNLGNKPVMTEMERRQWREIEEKSLPT